MTVITIGHGQSDISSNPWGEFLAFLIAVILFGKVRIWRMLDPSMKSGSRFLNISFSTCQEKVNLWIQASCISLKNWLYCMLGIGDGLGKYIPYEKKKNYHILKSAKSNKCFFMFRGYFTLSFIDILVLILGI